MRTLGLVLVLGCGNSSSGHLPDAPPAARDAPVHGDTAIDDATCIAEQPCTSNPNPTCAAGATACTNGVESCVDGAWLADGQTCTTGTCSGGQCLGDITFSNLDISQATLTGGRTCADSPRLAVAALGALTATLTAAPVDDCLVAGDEVMLISLQGSATSTVNVGAWELLRVASVAGAIVTFTTPKVQNYGDGPGVDTGIGPGATDQKVALVRVPHYGGAAIPASVHVTTAAWNGSTGGVLAMRFASATVDGTIDADALGYREGRWSEDANCVDSVTTESGESIAGPALAQVAPHAGAAGGIGAATASSFNGNTPVASSPGHATAGQAGFNGGARAIGAAGAIYGVADATKLTFGTGSTGDLSCGNGQGAAALVVSGGSRGGGIVALFAGNITVGAAGSIRASALDASRDVAGSGGYVLLRGATVAIGNALVTARGSTAHGGSPATSGLSNVGGAGYVAIHATTLTGTSSPAATSIP